METNEWRSGCRAVPRAVTLPMLLDAGLPLNSEMWHPLQDDVEILLLLIRDADFSPSDNLRLV